MEGPGRPVSLIEPESGPASTFVVAGRAEEGGEVADGCRHTRPPVLRGAYEFTKRCRNRSVDDSDQVLV